MSRMAANCNESLPTLFQSSIWQWLHQLDLSLGASDFISPECYDITSSAYSLGQHLSDGLLSTSSPPSSYIDPSFLSSTSFQDAHNTYIFGISFRVWSFIIATPCVTIACLLSFWHMLQHCSYNRDAQIRRHILRILFMVPIYAVNAYLALTFPFHIEFFTLFRECYESVTIYSLAQFLFLYLGGETRMLYLLSLEKPSEDAFHMYRLAQNLQNDRILTYTSADTDVDFLDQSCSPQIPISSSLSSNSTQQRSLNTIQRNSDISGSTSSSTSPLQPEMGPAVAYIEPTDGLSQQNVSPLQLLPHTMTSQVVEVHVPLNLSRNHIDSYHNLTTDIDSSTSAFAQLYLLRLLEYKESKKWWRKACACCCRYKSQVLYPTDEAFDKLCTTDISTETRSTAPDLEWFETLVPAPNQSSSQPHPAVDTTAALALSSCYTPPLKASICNVTSEPTQDIPGFQLYDPTVVSSMAASISDVGSSEASTAAAAAAATPIQEDIVSTAASPSISSSQLSPVSSTRSATTPSRRLPRTSSQDFSLPPPVPSGFNQSSSRAIATVIDTAHIDSIPTQNNTVLPHRRFPQANSSEMIAHGLHRGIEPSAAPISVAPSPSHSVSSSEKFLPSTMLPFNANTLRAMLERHGKRLVTHASRVSAPEPMHSEVTKFIDFEPAARLPPSHSRDTAINNPTDLEDLSALDTIPNIDHHHQHHISTMQSSSSRADLLTSSQFPTSSSSYQAEATALQATIPTISFIVRSMSPSIPATSYDRESLRKLLRKLRDPHYKSQHNDLSQHVTSASLSSSSSSAIPSSVSPISVSPPPNVSLSSHPRRVEDAKTALLSSPSSTLSTSSPDQTTSGTAAAYLAPSKSSHYGTLDSSSPRHQLVAHHVDYASIAIDPLMMSTGEKKLLKQQRKQQRKSHHQTLAEALLRSESRRLDTSSPSSYSQQPHSPRLQTQSIDGHGGTGSGGQNVVAAAFPSTRSLTLPRSTLDAPYVQLYQPDGELDLKTINEQSTSSSLLTSQRHLPQSTRRTIPNTTSLQLPLLNTSSYDDNQQEHVIASHPTDATNSNTGSTSLAEQGQEILVEYEPKQHAAQMTFEHLFPVNWLFQPVTAERVVFISKFGILQYVPIQIMCSIIAMTAHQFHLYHPGQWSANDFNPYLSFIINCSQFFAMYALFFFLHHFSANLKPARAMHKALTIKAVVFASFWQSLIISLYFTWFPVCYSSGESHTSHGHPLRPCEPGEWTNDQRAATITNFLICIEMLIFAILHMIMFRWQEFGREMQYDPKRPVLRRVLEFFSANDIYAHVNENMTLNNLRRVMQTDTATDVNDDDNDTNEQSDNNGSSDDDDDDDSSSSSSDDQEEPTQDVNRSSPEDLPNSKASINADGYV